MSNDNRRMDYLLDFLSTEIQIHGEAAPREVSNAIQEGSIQGPARHVVYSTMTPKRATLSPIGAILVGARTVEELAAFICRHKDKHPESA